MNNNQKFKISKPAVIGALLIIAAVAAIYINQLNIAVANNINGTISELAEHDQNSIQIYIEETWQQLEYMRDKFSGANCETIEEMETLMNTESANSSFSHIYMVAEDGKIYTDKYLTYDPESSGQNGRIDLLPYFQQKGDRIVTRFDDNIDISGLSKESILYGIKLDNFSVNGIEMKGLVGMTDITTIQDRLSIKNFVKDGVNRGYSAVIDKNGNYIVNESSNSYLYETENFFDRMNSVKKSEMTPESISEKMDSNEIFSFQCTKSNGAKRIVYCTPFPDSDIDWYFVLSVEKVVFNEQNKTFIVMSMVMLVCILVVIIILLTYINISQKNAMTAIEESRAKSRFLANMSHEIRTPLNGILGMVYLMEKDIDNGCGRETIKTKLKKTESTAEYLLSLINNILDISKLQSGKIVLNKESVSPELIADAICSMQKGNIESRGINLVTEMNILVPWIEGDDILIKRVLMNIIGNAAKFTPAGGTITFSVDQKWEDNGLVATTFTCKDTGCGMDQEFMEHIWDTFTQEHRSENSKSSGGTGLGMAISKLLIDAMGGEISVDSKPGQGSTFTVTLHSSSASRILPRFSQQDDEKDSQAEAAPCKIIVAEDNELNAEILVEVLKGEGFEVAHAANGKEAVDIFSNSEENEYSLILMDMQMPVMDGCAATEKIRSLSRRDAGTIQIFACTANTFKEDRNRAYQSGMNDFLAKPIDVNELIQKIEGI